MVIAFIESDHNNSQSFSTKQHSETSVNVPRPFFQPTSNFLFDFMDCLSAKSCVDCGWRAMGLLNCITRAEIQANEEALS
jgi:hypothetical protein